MAEGVLLMTSGYRTAALQVPYPEREYRRVGAAKSELSALPMDCDILATTYSWTGQVLSQEVTANILLDELLPATLVDTWDRKCSWYQLVGNSAQLIQLSEQHSERSERKAELLRQALTATVRKELGEIEVYLKRLQEGLDFCQVGFIRRRPVYRVDGRPLDICLALREHGCAGPNHDIDVKPTRIGMGPTVHLNVVCTKARGVPLDSFQALAPCLYKDHEPTDPASRAFGYGEEIYSDMTVRDIADLLQKIYCARHPQWQAASRPKLKFYGKILDEARRGEEVFVHHRGGTYSETVYLIMDLEPYVRLVPVEEIAVEIAATEVLQIVVSDVRDAIFSLANPFANQGEEFQPIR